MYEVHDPNVPIQPFPVVTHPVINLLQSVSEAVDIGASMHYLTTQLVPDPYLHGPSLPFISRHVVAVPVSDPH